MGAASRAIGVIATESADESATRGSTRHAARPTPRTSLTNTKMRQAAATHDPGATSSMPRQVPAGVSTPVSIAARLTVVRGADARETVAPPAEKPAEERTDAAATSAPAHEEAVAATVITPNMTPTRRRATRKAAKATSADRPHVSSRSRSRSEARSKARIARATKAATKGERPSRVAMVPALKKALVVLGIIAFAAVMVYGPARDYYVARRTNQDLNAQLTTINANNDQLTDDVSSLETREGIEDEARRRGYVSEGDTAVTMTDVEDTGTDTAAAVTSDDLETASARDLPWYVSALDVVFQYQGVS